jgi:hypothetical protein
MDCDIRMNVKTIELGNFPTEKYPLKIHRKIELPLPKRVPRKTQKHERGRFAWRLLHTQQLPDPDWFEAWKEYIPKKCGCQQGADDLLTLCPPRYESPEDWFAWTIEYHNAVNTKLNKPTVSLDRARMLWRHERPATNRQRAIVTVANGTEFVELLKLTRPAMQAYADRVGADLIDLDNDTADWGFMEKFRTFHFARQYEQTLFVDVDAIITNRCPDLFDMYADADIAAHDDWSFLFKTDWLERERNTVANRSGLAIEHTAQCLNSGIVLVDQSAADVWNKPLVDIGTSHCAEQIYLEHNIANAISSGASFANLDSRANWQWWFSTHHEGRWEAGLDDAWIVHFANAPKRYQTIKDFLDNHQPKECCHGMDDCQAGKECCRNQD